MASDDLSPTLSLIALLQYATGMALYRGPPSKGPNTVDKEATSPATSTRTVTTIMAVRLFIHGLRPRFVPALPGERKQCGFPVGQEIERTKPCVRTATARWALT